MSRSVRRFSLFAALVGAMLFCAGGTWAQAPAEAESAPMAERLPKRLEGVDVHEKLGAALILDLGFKDSLGRDVMLGDYFDGTLPVILTLNYSDCPMLCSLILNGLVKSLKQIDLVLGKDYRIVTVSLNPNEKPARAHATQQRYLAQYARPESLNGWVVLTGSANNIKAVAHSVGFEYAYNEARDEYVHPSAFVIAMPDGHIARYIYGIEYLPDTLRLSLVEASEGKVGTTLDRILLYCFHYDETEGRYAPVAMNIMRLTGGVGALLLGGFLLLLWRGELRKKKLVESTV